MTTSKFSDFNLCPAFLSALEGRGFEHPTPVQEQVFSQDDLNRDFVVQARTGSGKTLAFLLPLMNDIVGGSRLPRLLVLSPTRELAQQIATEAEFLGKTRGLATATLVGGMSMDPQIMKLRRGASVVVGTPGRILDHLRRGTLKLEELDTVVLDEGDNMLDMGFREELESILDAASNRKRTWLFSATMPDEVFRLCHRYQANPQHLRLDEEETQHEDIVHRAYLVPSRQKYEALVNILLWEHPTLSLIFCHTRNDTAEVAERLQEEGFLAMTLHGDMSQRERNSALVAFRSGRIPILVATNVAARGLDIEGVSHVIQLGLPESMETFVHRSGRTGRAGHEGTNLLVLTPQESGRFKFMLRSTSMKVEWLKVPDVAEISVIQRELREEALLQATATPEIQAWAETMLNRVSNPVELTARLLSTIVKDIPTGYSLRDALQTELDRRSQRAAERRGERMPRREGSFRSGPAASGTRDRFTGKGMSIRIAKGRRDDEWSVGRILGALCSALGVDRTEIGNIRMRDNHTEVELSPEALSQLDQGGRSRLMDRGLLSGGDDDMATNRGSSRPRESRFSRDGERRFDRSAPRPERRFERRDRPAAGKDRERPVRERDFSEFQRRARMDDQ